MKKLTTTLWAVLTAALLSGCTGLQAVQDARARADAGEDADSLVALLSVAQEDVRAAQALAESAGDEAAIACWPALADWLEHLRTYRELAEEVEGAGVAVAYQRARNIRRRVDFGVPMAVEVRCAALFGDRSSFARRLVLRLGL